LFHAGPALGVFPSGLISPAGPRLSRASCPLVVSSLCLVGAPASRPAAGFLGASCKSCRSAFAERRCSELAPLQGLHLRGCLYLSSSY
jgi:hypothetical protein